MAISFMKKGTEGAQLSKQADAEQERRKAASGGGDTIWRHWMPDGSEKQLTFLDGPLSEAGLLDVPRYWEHQLKLGDSWKNWFPCIKDDEPCPLCDIKQPALVYAFTVIDHTEWAEKKNPDKVHQHERKLFICKGEAYKRLSKIAVKREGLAGCTFDVSRLGENAEAVGNDFDFVEKLSLKKIAKKYGLATKGETGDNKVAQPYDYEEVIKYCTAEELRNMGAVYGDKPVGAADMTAEKPKKEKKKKDKKKKDKKKKDKKDKKDKKKKDKGKKSKDQDSDFDDDV